MRTTVDILEGNRFVVSDTRGDIDGTPIEPHGFFANDTRFLSKWIVTVDGVRPSLLSVDTTKYYEAQFFLAPSSGTTYIDSSLVLSRNRIVLDGFREVVTLTNFGNEPATVHLEIAAAADFADLFEVKDATVDRKRGNTSVQVDADRLAFLYQRDAFVRTTIIVSSSDDVSYREQGLEASVTLAPQQQWTTAIDVIALNDVTTVPERAARDEQFRDPATRLGLRSWIDATPSLECNWKPLPRIYETSMRDLAALRFTGPLRHHDALPAAGLPWFMTMFGRDSLITSLQAIPFAPELAHATLLTLADFQARTVDPFRDAEPGKILHEMRFGELTAFEERPHSPYYGSADSSPLFVILLDEYERWTGRADVVRQLEPAARAALAWIDAYGDRDGDGYIEYERRNTETGLENQCWKDSWDSIQWADGRLAELPRATCELQGYAYDAKRRASRLARVVWDDEALATRLEESAAALKAQFNKDFWLPDRGYFALALDGRKQPVDTLTSNIGHLLWSGIVDDDKIGAVVEQLMSDRLFSGWGIRTLATGQTGYNPIGYHVGTVWPHDTAISVLGLRRAGYAAVAARVAVALLEAAELFDGRLPEAFAGFDRAETGFPVEYPTACSPQAWASGAPLMLLRALLGLEPDGQLLRSDPVLAGPIRSLRLEGIPGRWGAGQVSVEATSGVERATEVDGGAEIGELIARADVTTTRGIHAVYGFDVGGRRRFLVVDDGRVVLSESGPAPDLVVETSPDVLNAVARGETNLNTAVMSGRIKLHGDMALLLVLRAMIDGTSVGQSA
jgi:glycogen debranching enzyme